MKHALPVLCLLLLSVLFSLSGCDSSVDDQTQELDLSEITATQEDGSFSGSIDLSDWDPSCYKFLAIGSSFWVQNVTDTLFFGCRFAGERVSQSLRAYNRGNSDLIVRVQLDNSRFATSDSVVIRPSTVGAIRIQFVLPDTSSTVYNGVATVRFSTHETMNWKLRGYRAKPDTGRVVASVPTVFSLEPAFPNPSVGRISFLFAVAQRSDGVLYVINKKSEVVATIAQRNYQAGMYAVNWDSNLPNGNYRVVFQAGSYTSKGDIQIQR